MQKLHHNLKVNGNGYMINHITLITIHVRNNLLHKFTQMFFLPERARQESDIVATFFIFTFEGR